MATSATNIQGMAGQQPMGRNPSAMGFYIRQDLVSGTYDASFGSETLITEVCTAVHEAFNATSPALTVGDAASSTGFFGAGDVNLTTLGAVSSSKSAGEAYAAGRFYPTGGLLRFTWVRGTPAAVPTGLLHIAVLFVNMTVWNGSRNVGS